MDLLVLYEREHLYRVIRALIRAGAARNLDERAAAYDEADRYMGELEVMLTQAKQNQVKSKPFPFAP